MGEGVVAEALLPKRLVVAHGVDTAAVGSGFFGFAEFQVALAGVSGLGRIHAGAKAGFFQEVAPSCVRVGRGLTVLVFTHGRFGVLTALDDFDYSSGNIGTNVVTDEDVGRLGIVEGQKGSVLRVVVS
jgi:hypothetical protein